MANMKKLFEKNIIDEHSPLYFGIWTYNGRMFKITSSLKNGLSAWKIEVRSTTGKWTFETGNLIFENTLASYTQKRCRNKYLAGFFKWNYCCRAVYKECL